MTGQRPTNNAAAVNARLDAIEAELSTIDAQISERKGWKPEAAKSLLARREELMLAGREARQLEALETWLRQSWWSCHETACLFFGVLPPNRDMDSREFGAWLPGREPWEHQRGVWEKHIAAPAIRKIEAELQKRELFRKYAVPQDCLAAGPELGIRPPWLDWAKRDPVCLSLLPPNLISEGERRDIVDARAVLAANARKAAAVSHLKGAPERKARVDRVRELDAEGKSRKEIAEVLEQEFGKSWATCNRDILKVLGPARTRAS